MGNRSAIIDLQGHGPSGGGGASLDWIAGEGELASTQYDLTTTIPPSLGGNMNVLTVTTNLIYAFPFVPAADHRMTELGYWMGSNSVGNFVAGLFDSDGTNNRPGTRLVYAEGATGLPFNQVNRVALNYDLTQGHKYFAALVWSVGVQVKSGDQFEFFTPAFGRDDTLASVQSKWCMTVAHTYDSALPATWPGGEGYIMGTTADSPFFWPLFGATP